MTTVLDTTADPRRLRGRGALSNAAGRYERERRVLLDDGWHTPNDDEPLSCVALGTGRVLDELDLLKKVAIPA